MSKYLLKTTEVFRVDSEDAATRLIEDAKQDSGYMVTKSTSEYRCKKVKGEIEEEWWRVTIQKQFNDEKDPDSIVEINYNVKGYSFPEPQED